MFNSWDQADKQLFNDISGSYVLKDRIPYSRLLRKLRLVSTLAGFSQPLGSLLELGCGAGYAAEYLRGRYGEYVGVDYSERLIAYARQTHCYSNVRFNCCNINELNIQGQFDLILMVGVLHHVGDVSFILNQIKKWLKKGGMVIVNEPQKGNPLIGLGRNIRKRFDKAYSKDQIVFTEDELKAKFVSSGYLVKACPQGYLSTPLAETSLFPNWIGLPLAKMFQVIDPVLERSLASTPCRRWSWNIVMQACLAT